MNLKDAERVLFVGLGEAVLEYSYPAISKLEEEGIVRIVGCADINNLKGTFDNLDLRYEKYPKEKESIDKIRKKVGEGNFSHHQTSGDSFGENPKVVLDEADIIYIATPNNVRAGFVKESVDAGKGVIIEKPVAHTRGGVRNLFSLCNGAKVICAEHYMYKDPSLDFLANFDDKTRNFGKITSIEGALVEDDFLEAERYKWLLNPSISGGGIFIDTGIHMMNLLYATGAGAGELLRGTCYRHLFDDERKEVVRSETAADIFFELKNESGNIDNNAYGHITVAKCAKIPRKFFKVGFEREEVFLDFIENSISYTNRATGVFEKKVLDKTEPYSNMMKGFIDYLNNGKEPPTTFSKVRKGSEAIFDIYNQMKEGDWRQYY